MAGSCESAADWAAPDDSRHFVLAKIEVQWIKAVAQCTLNP